MERRTRHAGFRLPNHLMDRLEDWCGSQRPVVTKTAVVAMLIEQFLDAEGHRGTTIRVGSANGAERKGATR